MSNRSDDFNRANSTTSLGTPSDAGGAWTAHRGTWGINGNQGYAPSHPADHCTATLDAAVAGAEVEVTLPTIQTAGTYTALCARLSTADNFYYAIFDSGTWTLRKQVAAIDTDLGTWSGTFTNGDVLKLVCSGNVVSFYHNGTLRITPASDTFNNTATRFGLWTFGADTTPRWDTFSITDPAAGGAVKPPKPLMVNTAPMRSFSY